MVLLAGSWTRPPAGWGCFYQEGLVPTFSTPAFVRATQTYLEAENTNKVCLQGFLTASTAVTPLTFDLPPGSAETSKDFQGKSRNLKETQVRAMWVCYKQWDKLGTGELPLAEGSSLALHSWLSVCCSITLLDTTEAQSATVSVLVPVCKRLTDCFKPLLVSRKRRVRRKSPLDG